MLWERWGKMLQSSPRIFKFSWFFRCLLIVTPTENSSPAPSVPGHVDSILSVCIYCLAAGLQKINSSVYKGRQTPWPAQELHILSVRNSQSRAASQWARQAVSLPRGPEVPGRSRVRLEQRPGPERSGRGDAGRVRGCPAALTTSSLGGWWAREGAVVVLSATSWHFTTAYSWVTVGSLAFECQGLETHAHIFIQEALPSDVTPLAPKSGC